MAPPLPMVPCKARAVGCALAAPLSLVWCVEMQLIKKQRGGRGLGLRWPPFDDPMQQSTRQSAEAVGGVLERRRAGQGARGGRPSHCLGRRIDRQKKYNIKYTAALNGRRSIISNATTNQKLVAATGGSMEGRFDEREARGSAISLNFGGAKSK